MGGPYSTNGFTLCLQHGKKDVILGRGYMTISQIESLQNVGQSIVNNAASYTEDNSLM